MKFVKKTLAVVLLFLCAVSSIAATPKKQVTVQIVADGATFEKEYELSKDLPFFARLFTFNFAKLAKRLKEKIPNDADVLDKMFCGITEDIEKFCIGLDVEPKDATALFTPNGSQKFTYTAEKCGRTVNREKIFENVIDNLNKRKISVSAEYTVLYPKLTAKALKHNTVFRGAFKTYFGSSGAARQKNILLAASFLNGTRVPCGATFSFNETIGRRTAERGFKEAPIISDGKFVGGVGGGVCQVSTTLYNAVLYADLAVCCVNRHSLPVKYVKPSFDAMVSSVSDFRFCNDSGADIYLEAHCENGFLEITVYGAPMTYEIRLISETTGTLPRAVEYITDDTLSDGEEKTVIEGADGVISRGYLERWRDNYKIERVLIRRDTYNSQKKVIAKSLFNCEEGVIKD